MTSIVVSVPHSKIQPIDPKTGQFVREWYLCYQNLYAMVGGVSGGSTTQVLHGGGAYEAVNVGTEVTGILLGVHGGTGVSNSGKTLTLGGNVNFSGSGPIVISVTGSASVVIPTSGTLAAISDIGSLGFQSSSNVNISGGTVSSVSLTSVKFTSTVGTTTATFTAVNKPGVSTTTPDKWISIQIDGVTRFIPCWP